MRILAITDMFCVYINDEFFCHLFLCFVCWWPVNFCSVSFAWFEQVGFFSLSHFHVDLVLLRDFFFIRSWSYLLFRFGFGQCMHTMRSFAFAVIIDIALTNINKYHYLCNDYMALHCVWLKQSSTPLTLSLSLFFSFTFFIFITA